MPKFLSNSIGKLLVIGIAAIILVIIIGSAFKGESHDINSDLLSLKAQLDSFSKTIDDYGGSATDSTLRSATASLSSALAESNQELTDYLSENYDFAKKGLPEEVSAAEAEYYTVLNGELAVARAGQFFDRAYARKIIFALERLMANEYDIYDYAKEDDAKNLLAGFYNNLATIYNIFNNYSK